MPNARRYRKRNTRRRPGRTKKYARRRNYRRGNVMRSRIGPLPARFITKLRYCETRTLTPGLPGFASNILYVANGPYDPYYALGGHQPLGWDQLVGVLYNHVNVYKAKITCEFLSLDGTAANGGSIVGINVCDNATPVLTADTICEQPHTTYGAMTTAFSGTARKKLTKWYTWKTFNGGKSAMDTDNQTTGTSNPLEQQYFNVWATSPGAAIDPANIQVLVSITYYCILSEPKQLGQS